LARDFKSSTRHLVCALDTSNNLIPPLMRQSASAFPCGEMRKTKECSSIITAMGSLSRRHQASCGSSTKIILNTFPLAYMSCNHGSLGPVCSCTMSPMLVTSSPISAPSSRNTRRKMLRQGGKTQMLKSRIIATASNSLHAAKTRNYQQIRIYLLTFSPAV
jgi:hypothetical protein